MVEMEIVYEIGLFPWRKVELKVEIAGYSTMFYCMYPRIVNTVDTVRPLSFWANLSFRWWMITRWWFQIFVIFTPIWGKIPILIDIFQMGWKHQLDNL